MLESKSWSHAYLKKRRRGGLGGMENQKNKSCCKYFVHILGIQKKKKKKQEEQNRNLGTI